MKKFALLFVTFQFSLLSIAGNWTYNRLNRLYQSDPWKCVEVSKNYMKRTPDKADPYYFASAVYKEKSKKHGQIKTRYMMMSKALRYATHFEEFEDLNLMSKVNWGMYVRDLQVETDALIRDLDSSEMGDLGEKLEEKCDHLLFLHKKVIIEELPLETPGDLAATNETDESNENAESEFFLGYSGLARGNEVAPSANKIQEQELLKLINAERAELFMSPLKWDESLARAARYHANDMAAENYLLDDSYDRVNGQLKFVAKADQRTGQFQLKNNTYFQNIAGGPTSAAITLLQWMEKDASYDVLFTDSNKAVGIGLAYDANSASGYYWVLVAAKKR